jgi:predicted transcriptional regulator of viral defense system
MLLSPSHVSLESALWHHGLIPEGVREVASVTPRRARSFDTPLGSFSFHTVASRDPRAGVRAVEIDRGAWAFVATPIRAIADLIYLRRSVDYATDGIAFLADSLRIDLDAFPAIDADELREIAGSIRSPRTRAYLAGMAAELGT